MPFHPPNKINSTIVSWLSLSKIFLSPKENMGYTKKKRKSMLKSMREKKERINIHAKKHERKKREERKKRKLIFSKPKQKREAWPRSSNKKFKIPHTYTSWSKCMTCISSDPVFDLATLCDASMPLFHSYLKLHRKTIRM